MARPSARQLARIRKLPLSEAKFKKDAGMLPGVRLWGETQYSLLERWWTRPALTAPFALNEAVRDHAAVHDGRR